jgi:glutaredoxin
VRIQILGRAGCHLCDVARDIVEIVAAETGTDFVEVDVDADPQLKARYSDYVPVLLVDGKEHSHWRVDAARLRAALSADPAS